MQISDEEVRRLGEEYYESIRPSLLGRYYGKYIAIDPMSYDWFVGDTVAEALAKAREKHPGRKFFVAKVGAERGVIGVFHRFAGA